MKGGKKMFFITEADLREQLKNKSFSDFKLPPETKLTPGARQFLLDNRVNLYDDIYSSKKNTTNKTSKDDKQVDRSKYGNMNKKFIGNIRLLHLETLLCGSLLIEKDISIIQDISKISRQILEIKKYVQSSEMVEFVEYKKCSGISEEAFSSYIDDCFEINELHMQAENSNDILHLHRLRVLYRNFYDEIDDYEFENDILKTIKESLNRIINTLSRLICAVCGSKKCQKL
ncbi:hypothetical protein HMPREF0379_0299 [[Eubacterium] yurii subsp. margaretiae ATCC 43715]|nr:hypothetical protein HMPREF0379_0299 [[Eubacterium] yurii subsp. margaretiae ATCC 43715]